MSIRNSKLARSTISHYRAEPKTHGFQYKIAYLWLDLDEIDAIVRLSWLWSTSRFNIVRLDPDDYLKQSGYLKKSYCADYKNENFNDVKQAVFSHVEQQFAQLSDDYKKNARVMLLTVPRYLGYAMNPVSFYFVFSDAQQSNNHLQLDYIVSEITNTPWHERHVYVQQHNCAKSFDKVFHVSPFMPMNIEYNWKFKVTDSQIHINMNLYKKHQQTNTQKNTDESVVMFNANMRVQLNRLSNTAIRWYSFLYPLQSLKVAVGIYWQALKLKIKGVPFHPHPKKIKENDAYEVSKNKSSQGTIR